MFPGFTVIEVIDEYFNDNSGMDEDRIDDDDGFPQPDFRMDWNASVIESYSINSVLKWAVDNMDEYNSGIASQLLSNL